MEHGQIPDDPLNERLDRCKVALLVLLSLLLAACANGPNQFSVRDFIKIDGVPTILHLYKNAIGGHAVLLPNENKLYFQDEVTVLLAQSDMHGCRLPSASEMRKLRVDTVLWQKTGLQQFYWVAEADVNIRGYALYFHFPTQEVMEFGDYVFPANIIFICS